MKHIYTLGVLLFLTLSSSAANLTATVTPAGTGKKDGKITLTISGGFAPYTINWTGPGGFTSSKANPDMLGAGTYCVTVTDQYCGVASMCVTVTEQSTGIAEAVPDPVNVYPNPFSGELFVELGEGAKGAVNLTLTDLSGKIVAEKQAEAQQRISWTLPNRLPAGAYLLTAILEDGTRLVSRVSTSGK